MKKWMVTTQAGDTRFVNAAYVEEDKQRNRITFYDDEDRPVAGFIAQQDFSIVEEI
jgi:hypothetical protein